MNMNPANVLTFLAKIHPPLSQEKSLQEKC